MWQYRIIKFYTLVLYCNQFKILIQSTSSAEYIKTDYIKSKPRQQFNIQRRFMFMRLGTRFDLKVSIKSNNEYLVEIKI